MDNLVHPLRSAARIAAEKDRSFTVHLHLQIVESSIFNFSGTFTALSGRTGFEVLQFFNINFYRLRLPGYRYSTGNVELFWKVSKYHLKKKLYR